MTQISYGLSYEHAGTVYTNPDDEECAVGKRQASKGKKRSRGWGQRVTPVWLIARRLGLRSRGGER